MSSNWRTILGFGGIMIATLALTGLTIWSFMRRNRDDSDEDDDMYGI